MRVAGLALALTTVASCSGSGGVTRGVEEPPQMVEAVLRRVPVGTPVGDAQRVMEREGFKCSRSTDAAFLGRTGLDYIYCDRSEGMVVQRRWQVAVVHRDGRVVEVLAATGLVGP